VTFSITRTVEFHETDMAGVVHFANFFKYFEAAESEYLRALGWSIFNADLNLRWPRVSVSCDFKRPVRFGDKVRVDLTVRSVDSRSLELDFVLYRESNDESSVAATGRCVNVCAYYDAASRRVRAHSMPDALLAALRADIGTSSEAATEPAK
jgi:acyl-CoA thioester hydrolase